MRLVPMEIFLKRQGGGGKKMGTTFQFEVMADISRGPRSDIFTLKDHTIVREAVAKLKGLEHEIVVRRFWENNTISEIAEILDLSWSEVEKALAIALEKLKVYCVKNQDFSRSVRGGRSQCGNQMPVSDILGKLKKAA